jgi:MFS family permease
LFGTLFHPAANALATAHYPKSPGMAVGIMGMGAGLGFFAGPHYAGWRAETAQWTWGSIAAWQRPCIEMGIAGVVVGAIFLLLAREAAARGQARALDVEHPPLGARLTKLVLSLAAVLGLRDFAGVASMSLLSIYLQKAHAYSVKQAGLVIGGMMLISVVVNPIAVWLTSGKRRLPALAFVLVAGGVVIATVPLWPVFYVLPVMALFQAFQLGSYAIADAAVLERVPPAVRGRVVGLFLTFAGTFASLSPWAMGFWTDMLRARAMEPSAYLPLFGTLGAMMLLAALCPPIIARLGAKQPPAIEAFSETLPATVEPLG